MSDSASFAARITAFVSQPPGPHDAEATAAAVATFSAGFAALTLDGLRSVLRDVALALTSEIGAITRAIERAKFLDPIENEPTPQRSVAVHLTGELLRARPELRLELANARKSHIAKWAVEQALPSVDLELSEIVALLAVPTERLRGHWLEGWAENHPDAARELVDHWLGFDDGLRQLDSEILLRVIVAVVRAEPDGTWHAHVIDNLERRCSEEAWRLCVRMATFAWPPPEPSASERHAAVLMRVARLPARLADAGLFALKRDATSAPDLVATTTLSIVDLLSRQPLETKYLQTVLSLAVDNLTTAIEQARKSGRSFEHTERLVGLLGQLSPRTPGGSVDHCLSALFKLDREVGRRALHGWLSRNAGALWQMDDALGKVLPLVTHEIDPVLLAEWHLDWVADPAVGLRMLAARFISVDEKLRLPPSKLYSMAPAQVVATAHQLLVAGAKGEVLVPHLWTLIDARPDLIDKLGPLLLDDVLEEYPGACQEEVERRRAQEPRDIDAKVALLEDRLLSSIESRTTAIDSRARVPELRVTSPGQIEAWRLVNRAIRRESAKARSQSVWSQLATHVPIIEGEASQDFGAEGSPTRFQRFSFSAELPRRGTWDPLGEQLRRLRHLQLAQDLLSGEVVDS